MKKQFLTIVTAVLIFGLVQIALAGDATGFGCYTDIDKLGGIKNWRAHVRLMKIAGMNTFFLWFNSPQQLADQIDIAIEEGMLESSIPVIAKPKMSAEKYKTFIPDWKKIMTDGKGPVSGWSEWEIKGGVLAAKEAKRLSKFPEKFPEIVFYNFDEPGKGKAADADIGNVGLVTAAFNKAGARCGTALAYPNIKNCIPMLDIPIICAINGADMLGSKQAVEKAGKDYWVYEIHSREATPEMVRWHIGYWMWQAGPKCHLSWNWKGFITGDMANPQPTKQLLGYARGVDLYKKLTETEALVKQLRSKGVKSLWLDATEKRIKELRDGFDWESWSVKELAEAKEKGNVWDAIPELDLDNLLPKPQQGSKPQSGS